MIGTYVILDLVQFCNVYVLSILLIGTTLAIGKIKIYRIICNSF